ncbi:MAG: hypothetical protein WC781_03920 [Candidatus Pacearchaeota archaeon]|jgi:hypothetical protein
MPIFFEENELMKEKSERAKENLRRSWVYTQSSLLKDKYPGKVLIAIPTDDESRQREGILSDYIVADSLEYLFTLLEKMECKRYIATKIGI